MVVAGSFMERSMLERDCIPALKSFWRGKGQGRCLISGLIFCAIAYENDADISLSPCIESDGDISFTALAGE